MKYVYKQFFEEKLMCAPSFLVCARLTTCVRAQNAEIRSLEGALLMTERSTIKETCWLLLFSCSPLGFRWIALGSSNWSVRLQTLLSLREWPPDRECRQWTCS